MSSYFLIAFLLNLLLLRAVSVSIDLEYVSLTWGVFKMFFLRSMAFLTRSKSISISSSGVLVMLGMLDDIILLRRYYTSQHRYRSCMLRKPS